MLFFRFVNDYQDRNFGEAWGMLIEELKILARGTFVLDADGNVAYAEVVPEAGRGLGGRRPEHAGEGRAAVHHRERPEPRRVRVHHEQPAHSADVAERGRRRRASNPGQKCGR